MTTQRIHKKSSDNDDDDDDDDDDDNDDDYHHHDGHHGSIGATCHIHHNDNDSAMSRQIGPKDHRNKDRTK